MSNSLVRQAMNDEMALVKERMTAIRAHIYYDINHQFNPAVVKLMQTGFPLDHLLADSGQVFPPVRTVAELLKVRGFPQLPAFWLCQVLEQEHSCTVV